MNLILLICLIIVQFQCTLCIHFFSDEEIARYTDSELIKVQLPQYEEEVLSCTLVVRFLSSEPPLDSLLLYDKESLFYSDNVFKYVGKDDNTCSFEIFPKKSRFFSYKNGSPLTQEWTVYERHVIDGSWYNTLQSWLGASDPDERKFNFYLSPQTFGERVQMAMSGQRITREAPYTNETITIITQPRRYVIRKCTLIISSDYFFQTGSKISNTILLYNKRFSPSVSTNETGLEFLGVDDNSCSYRMLMNNPKIENGNYFDIYWQIREEYEDTDFANKKYRSKKPIDRWYTFSMPSKFWWKNNKKSRMFIFDGTFKTTEQEYF